MPSRTLTKGSISVSKKMVDKNKGVVILSLKEYQKLCERAVPTYYLKGDKAESLDNLVSEGLDEFKNGKSKTLKSLADLG